MDKVRWGILGTAKIGIDRVIGPMQKSPNVSVDAIASRDLAKARAAAHRFGITTAYGSYEELLDDPGVHAIYIPLPNSMHVEWTRRAAESGKHVLIEKPIALNADEASSLIAVRDRTGVIIVEAFMVCYAPQWKKVREIIYAGKIGPVHAVQGYASFINLDPQNIRNRLEVGGGALMDIGCYLILFARMAFGSEPRRAASLVDRDPTMKTDRHTSIMLDFPNGHATLFVSTQLARAQRFKIFGEKGSIEVQIPINLPDDRPTRIIVDNGQDAIGSGASVVEFAPVNQYTLQGEAVSRMIQEGQKPEHSLEDAIANMRVIDALRKSETSNAWEKI